MASTAAEVVSMERAAHHSESSRSYLVPTINAFTAQLSAGVRQYNEMVTAAAQLVSSANGDADAGWSAVAAALPCRAGRGDRSAARLGAGVRRTRRIAAPLETRSCSDGSAIPAMPRSGRLGHVEQVKVVAPQRDSPVVHLEHAAYPELQPQRAEDQRVAAFGEHRGTVGGNAVDLHLERVRPSIRRNSFIARRRPWIVGSPTFS